MKQQQTKSFLVRNMPIELSIKLKMLAASRNISMEKLIIELLNKGVNQQSAGEHNEQDSRCNG